MMVRDLDAMLSTLRAALAATSVAARLAGLEQVLHAVAPGSVLAVRSARGPATPLLEARGRLGARARFWPLGAVRLPGCGCLRRSTGTAELGVASTRRMRAVERTPLVDVVLQSLQALALHHAIACSSGRLEDPGSVEGRQAAIVLDALRAPVVVEPEAPGLLALVPAEGGLVADAVVRAAAAGDAAGARCVLRVQGGALEVVARRLDREDTAVVVRAQGACAPPTALRALTPREVAVARRVARGETNAVVARALGIAPATVKRHLEHVYDKTGAHGRTELAALVLGGEVPPWVGRPGQRRGGLT